MVGNPEPEYSVRYDKSEWLEPTLEASSIVSRILPHIPHIAQTQLSDG